MTVCVAIRVNECIVFAADSATTLSVRLQSGAEEKIVFQNGHKVFNLDKRLPVCAMTYGTGNIGRASISLLSKEFRKRLGGDDPAWAIDPDNYTIEDICRKYHKFLTDAFSAQTLAPVWSQPMGLFVGGYSADATENELWTFQLLADGTSSGPSLIGPKGSGGFNVGGNAEAAIRLCFGFDPNLEQHLTDELADASTAAELCQKFRKKSERSILWDAMPVQDAIDLANYLVDVTKGYVRFQIGHDTVGGPTDVAVVTKHEGFKWVTRKHYFPEGLNHGGQT